MRGVLDPPCLPNNRFWGVYRLRIIGLPSRRARRPPSGTRVRGLGVSRVGDLEARLLAGAARLAPRPADARPLAEMAKAPLVRGPDAGQGRDQVAVAPREGGR